MREKQVADIARTKKFHGAKPRVKLEIPIFLIYIQHPAIPVLVLPTGRASRFPGCGSGRGDRFPVHAGLNGTGGAGNEARRGGCAPRVGLVFLDLGNEGWGLETTRRSRIGGEGLGRARELGAGVKSRDGGGKTWFRGRRGGERGRLEEEGGEIGIVDVDLAFPPIHPFFLRLGFSSLLKAGSRGLLFYFFIMFRTNIPACYRLPV